VFKSELYPKLSVKNNLKPNRFYATPLFGGLIKIIILIPQMIEVFILIPVVFVLVIINSLYVLIFGKYWDTAYGLTLNLVRFFIKTYFFWAGIFDSYPGFSLSTDGKFVLDIKKPVTPNRLFAFPIFGGLVRLLFLIPYLVYSQVLGNGSWVGVIISSFPVFFKGKYPQSTYEFAVDAERVGLGLFFNMVGFSDKYPSFKISMSHKNVKIILIAIGIIFFIFNNGSKSWFKLQSFY